MHFPIIADLLRAWPIAVVALAMFVIAAATSGISLAVTLYGFGKIAAAGYIGYWIDRLVFPYARPHHFRDADVDGSVYFSDLTPQIRRAIVVAACVIAAGLSA